MKTLTTETALKKRIWDACLQKQQTVANTTKEAMDQAQQSANEEKGSMEEKFESFREQLIRDRDMYARKLAEQISGIATLRQIDSNKLMNTVQLGAVVTTDKQKFFISIGLGEIKIDGEIYYAISTQSPLYQQMDRKKAGETFEFRNLINTVENVF